MSTEQAVVVSSTSNDENVCYIRITRSDKGIDVFLKSSKIEDFMRKNHHFKPVESEDRKHNRYSDQAGWRNHLGYMVNPNGDVKGLSGNLTNYWGGELMLGANGPNLSFLQARGLSNGVTFELEGIYSQTTIQKWAEEVRKYITNFYREFLKSCNLHLKVTLTEIQ